MGYLTRALRLKGKSLAMDSEDQFGDLLQTPKIEFEKPLLIESGYLKDTFYLAANEAQAGKIEKAGGVCYLPSEVHALLDNSMRMGEEASKEYLGKIHMVKRVFPGARIMIDATSTRR